MSTSGAMDPKEKFLKKDRIIKGIADQESVKISVIKTTDVIKEAQNRHKLSPAVAVMLGRTMTGTMLIAAQLKGEERIKVTVQNDGPLGNIYAEANSVGEMRGYVSRPQTYIDWTKVSDITEVIGDGTLKVEKVIYNEAKPISGVVALADKTITGDFVHYLGQSEQVKSMLALDVQIDEDGMVSEAGGILVQALPGADESLLKGIHDLIKNFPPLGNQFAEGAYIDDIMNMVLLPAQPKELDRYPVHFFCRCNKDRFVDALALLSVDDLETMNSEDQEVICHFCNEKYVIEKETVQKLFMKAKTKLN
jgi:molecular chaperone Hsp33